MPTLLDRMLEGTEKRADFSGFVHHPLVQALGYGALAGEGAHALAGMAHPESRTYRMAHSPAGKAVGAGLIGTSSAFLGAEAASALSDYFKRRREQTQEEIPKASADTLFMDELGKRAAESVVVESHPVLTRPWFKEMGRAAVKGAVTAGVGTPVAFGMFQLLSKLKGKESKRKGKAPQDQVPIVVKV